MHPHLHAHQYAQSIPSPDAGSLPRMLALQQYIEFVMHLIAAERIARGLRMAEVVKTAQMIQDLHAGFQARWRLPSPALETRMIDYLVELSVIRPACY